MVSSSRDKKQAIISARKPAWSLLLTYYFFLKHPGISMKIMLSLPISRMFKEKGACD